MCVCVNYCIINGGDSKIAELRTVLQGGGSGLMVVWTEGVGQRPEGCEGRGDPDLVQAFLGGWWV